MNDNEINKIQNEIIDEFSFFEDWTDKYKYIIDLGKELPVLDEKYKTDDMKVRGCQSNVWLRALDENGKVKYEADSDALIAKGLIALLIRVLGGKAANEISASDLYFIDKIGMKEHLSQNRASGLASMLKQMKLYAMALQQKEKLQNG